MGVVWVRPDGKWTTTAPAGMAQWRSGVVGEEEQEQEQQEILLPPMPPPHGWHMGEARGVASTVDTTFTVVEASLSGIEVSEAEDLMLRRGTSQ